MTGPGGEEPRRTQVNSVSNGYLYAVSGGDLHVFSNGQPVYVLREWHPRAGPSDRYLREQPSRMLDAGAGLVPFVGRADELRQAWEWCRGPSPLAAAWLHGPGGRGKTRLAAQLADRARTAGWKVVTAGHGPHRIEPAPVEADVDARAHQGLLVLVDYADRWPLSHLTWLLSNAALHPPGVPARVLMLARTLDPWPAVQAALTRVDAEPFALAVPPLGTGGRGGAAERRMLFEAAGTAFARVHGLDPGWAPEPPPPLDQDTEFGSPLVVQMAALAQVDAYATGRRAPRGPAGLSAYLLRREEHRWAAAHPAEFALPPDEPETGAPYLVMRMLTFVAALSGPRTLSGAEAVLHRVAPGLPAARALADHARHYPPARRSFGLEPLLPDRLAEDFLALSLPGHRESYRPASWAPGFLAALLDQGDGEARAVPEPRRAVVFLLAAMERWPHVADHVVPLLSANPELVIAAGAEGLFGLARVGHERPQLVRAVLERCSGPSRGELAPAVAFLSRQNLYETFSRAGGTGTGGGDHEAMLTAAERLGEAGGHREAAALLRNGLDGLRDTPFSGDPAEARWRARFLMALARQLSMDDAAGAEALLVGEEAVRLARPLAESDPATFEPRLAELLLARSRAMLNSGVDPQRSANATREAYERAGRHAAAHPRVYAECAAAVAGGLRASGRPHDALRIVGEAVTLLAHAARAPEGSASGALLPPEGIVELGPLHGMLLAETGRAREAADVAHEAVRALRRLTELNPGRWQAGLASALADQSWILSRCGSGAEGLAAAQEAAALLADGSGRDFDRRTVNAWTVLASRYSDVGEHDRAAQLSVQARDEVEREIQRHSRPPQVLLSILADVCQNLGRQLTRGRRVVEAFGPFSQAVSVCEQLAERDPAVHGPRLREAESELLRIRERVTPRIGPAGPGGSVVLPGELRRRLRSRWQHSEEE